MPMDLSAGQNFLPCRLRYKLPLGKDNNSIYLLSNSFEYDIELIKTAPSPKMDYRNIIIPFKIIDKIEVRPFRFIKSQKDYISNVKYVQDQKLLPPVMNIPYPYPKKIKQNLYIPMSEIIKDFNKYIEIYPRQKMEDNIFNLFKWIFGKFNYSENKVLLIDTKHYPIHRTLTVHSYKSDLINALLTAYMYIQPDKLIGLPFTIIFRAPDADYKMDLRTFSRKDMTLMRNMLNKIGTISTSGSYEDSSDKSSNEQPTRDQIHDELRSIPDEHTVETEPTTVPAHESRKEELPEEDNKRFDDGSDVESPISNMNEEDIEGLRNKGNALSDSLKSKLAKLTAQLSDAAQLTQIQQTPSLVNPQKSLYNAKTIAINNELTKRITGKSNNNVSLQQQTQAQNLVNDIKQSQKENPVEAKILSKVAKDAAESNAITNEESINKTTTSPREEKIRKQVGQIKLNNVTFDTIVSKTDAPLPKPTRPNKIFTTNRAANIGSTYASVTKEYEEKLMDRDIVSVFMNLSELPNGFYVTNVEITDVSNVTSLMNNWRVTLRNKNTDRQSVINIRVPQVHNGRFYDAGIWYNIGKQDFPIPILKISKKKVIITSNYQKITVERYDTKSLVDITLFTNVINKVYGTGTKLKYIEPGISVATNARFISTIEFDEYAKRWRYFKNEEAACEIYFNREVCLKQYGFVKVNDNEFCCGMLNKVPIVVNTETGLTRDGRTLTDTMLSTIPDNLKTLYLKSRPGKLSMYASITIGCTIPLGVAICAWEGISSLIKKSNAGAKLVDKGRAEEGYFVIPFKDKDLAVPNNTPNQLIYNGFYRINTKAYNVGDFELPISDQNSVFVDIFNQHFFKQYSQLTTFITYYQFFLDPITKDVCLHYNIPQDIAGMLIYAANLLADNSFTSENNAALYRIRSSEIIPAIIHYRLAFAISKYNNTIGSKSRNAQLVFNPNEVVNELKAVPNVEPMSALNPMIELHLRETITKKGFKGVNDDRAYSLEKRTYDDTMIGKIAMSSPNSGNVGISRQLVADPKIDSVRGYTSDKPADGEYNDLQLASFSELLTSGTVSRDDAIRTAIATSQTGHIVPTAGAQPTLISNGVDELVSAYMTDEFSVLAEEDGKVLEITDEYMIVQYRSGKKRAINIGHRQSFNSGSGFFVDNKLIPALEVNKTFKQNDVLAYHERFFNKDSDGIVRMNVGPLAKIAFTGIYSTYEDAGIMTTKFSKRLATKLSMRQIIKLNASDDIEKVVKVGDEVEIEDPLVVFGLGDSGDKSVDNFLRAFQFDKEGNNVFLQNIKRSINAEHAGRIAEVKIYTNKSLDKLSPSLHKLVSDHFKANKKRREILDKHDGSDSPYKLGTLYDMATEPLKTPSIKGISCDVLIEIFIEHEDEVGVGDKCVAYGASKQIISEVVEEGLEPYAESDPNEEISMFVAPASILKRMIPSVVIIASANKVLVNLKRQVAQIWKEKETK